VQNLNSRVIELKETISRVNDLISAQNRQNLSASLGHVRGMLEEDRPKIKSTLTHIDSASAKMGPLIDDFKKTIAQAQDALAHVDGMIVDDRADVRQSIIELRQALASADSLTDQLDRTMNVNSDNIDEVLDNMRHITENLKHRDAFRLFEIGRAYSLRDAKPVETRILTLGASGLARERSIHEPAREFSFADLKGDLDSLGELTEGFHWDSGAPAWLHPAR